MTKIPLSSMFSSGYNYNYDESTTDGILRKAEMPIVDTDKCRSYLQANSRTSDFQFICAGGVGAAEESCFVSLDCNSFVSII